mmetsp:Transcript_33055/g.105395  ORF Transcript_33055/g.105395 Transcript_33055/m.105395 type:complete len:210 (+) Transcript_33055:990-1619(+)
MPAVFATAHDDALVRPHHSRLILDAYAGDKNLVTFDGDHNEMRPGFFLDSAAIFFTNVLRLDGSSALDVPTGQDGRPIPLSQALQFSYRLRHDVGDQSADLAAGADAQRQMMRAHMQVRRGGVVSRGGVVAAWAREGATAGASPATEAERGGAAAPAGLRGTSPPPCIFRRSWRISRRPRRRCWHGPSKSRSSRPRPRTLPRCPPNTPP